MAEQSFRGNFIVVGFSGSGKSTLGNVLINRSGENDKLNAPFSTSDGSMSCTYEFTWEQGMSVAILDTVGFRDTTQTDEEVGKRFSAALTDQKEGITAVLFVAKGDRIDKSLLDLYLMVCDVLLGSSCNSNTVFIVTGKPTHWVSKEREKNPYVQQIIERCGGRYCGFSLRMDDDQDDESDKYGNIKKRHSAVVGLIEYLNALKLVNIQVRGYPITANFLLAIALLRSALRNLMIQIPSSLVEACKREWAEFSSKKKN